jgi:hypothetical protein
MVLKFITFGSHNGGVHSNYIDAAIRLANQVKDLNIFDEILLYTGDGLKEDPEFWNKHEEFVTNNKKGFGYWLWKSYIIKKTIDKMNDEDILFFLDCGCEIEIEEKEWLEYCIEKVKTDKIVGTLATGQIENKWNKMDLIDKLEMNDDKYLNTTQRQGGANIYYISNETRDFVNKWYELCCDYSNINDSPSIKKNLETFIEHRHDQSVFSLLTKKYSIYSDINLDEKCIKIYRNKNGGSMLQYYKNIKQSS